MSNALEKWFGNKALSPFREFEGLETSFNRLFNDMLLTKKRNGTPEFNFSPSCDISDNEKVYILKFDMPGTVDEKKVEAKLENGVLTVSVPKTDSLKIKRVPVH